MHRGLKCRVYELEGVHYRCSENKGADKLRVYHAADLRLCFHASKKAGIVIMWLIYKTACKTELPFKLLVTVFSPILLAEGTYNVY